MWKKSFSHTMNFNNWNEWKIAGSRDNPHEVLSAPTSPTEPSKLSTNIGRNPLRGSKCKTFYFLSPQIFLFFYLLFTWLGFFSAWAFIWNLFSLQLWVLLMQLQQVIKMKIIALAKKKFNKRLHQLRLDWSGREKITQNSLFYNSHHIFIYYFALFHL